MAWAVRKCTLNSTPSDALTLSFVKSLAPTCSISRYSLYYGKNGAKVVVNDVSQQNAQKVVDEVKAGEFNRLLFCV